MSGNQEKTGGRFAALHIKVDQVADKHGKYIASMSTELATLVGRMNKIVEMHTALAVDNVRFTDAVSELDEKTQHAFGQANTWFIVFDKRLKDLEQTSQPCPPTSSPCSCTP